MRQLEPDLAWMGDPAATLGKVVKDTTVGLYSDAQLKAVAQGMRALCRQFNMERTAKPAGAASGGVGRPAWRCAVLDPWQASYSKHPMQRERRKEEVGGTGTSQSNEAGGWWIDSRGICTPAAI
jgi:hypothetical protein